MITFDKTHAVYVSIALSCTSQIVFAPLVVCKLQIIQYNF